MQRIVAGAGLEIRFRLAPRDGHDQVLTARQAGRSAALKASTAARHAHNLEQFAADSKRH